MKLLELSIVERLFSKMKLIKTRLRNQLSQVSLEFFYTEAPDNFADEEYDFFADELKRLNPKMRMDL